MNNPDNEREETRNPLIITIPACGLVVALHPDWHRLSGPIWFPFAGPALENEGGIRN
jgi:hypothetical protein